MILSRGGRGRVPLEPLFPKRVHASTVLRYRPSISGVEVIVLSVRASRASCARSPVFGAPPPHPTKLKLQRCHSRQSLIPWPLRTLPPSFLPSFMPSFPNYLLVIEPSSFPLQQPTTNKRRGKSGGGGAAVRRSLAAAGAAGGRREQEEEEDDY